ncbi:MAG: glycosyltransferase family 39 protein [bacterium]
MKSSFFNRGNRYHTINSIAQNIIKLHEFSEVPSSPTANHEPIYPLFVAFAYYLMNNKWFAVALLQSIINIINGIIIYYIAKIVLNNKIISLISMFLVLFYPYYIVSCNSVCDTIVFCFFLALSIYLIILSCRNQNFWAILACGCCWGLTLLTRFSAISIFCFALIYFFMNLPYSRAIKSSIIILFGCLLILIPWLYRNYILTGKFFVTTRGAIEIWFGYNDDSFEIINNNISVDKMRKDLDEKVPSLKGVRQRNYHSSIFKEIEEYKIFINEAIAFIINNPWQSFKMMPIKFMKFWSWNFNPIPFPRSTESFLFKIRRIVYTISYLPILLLGILGIWLTRYCWRTHSIFLLIFIGYSVMHTIIYGFTRLRVPIDQFLIIYAAYSIFYYMKKLNIISIS